MSVDISLIIGHVKTSAYKAAQSHKNDKILPLVPSTREFEDMWIRLEGLDTEPYENNIEQLFIERFDYEISLIIQNDFFK